MLPGPLSLEPEVGRSVVARQPPLVDARLERAAGALKAIVPVFAKLWVQEAPAVGGAAADTGLIRGVSDAPTFLWRL